VATAEEEVRIDPCGAYNFEVEINDVAVGFAEVFGLDASSTTPRTANR
jgi:hypothetical protein